MPSFTDTEGGEETAYEFLAKGVDVIFGAGAATGSAGM